jgi:uncharacterized membrane protein
MSDHDGPTGRDVQRLVFGVTLLAALALLALTRVTTYLGVKVVEARGSNSYIPPAYFRGREYIWRVWWRARDDMVDISPSWLLGAALILMLVAFGAAVIAAFRLALAIPPDPAPRAD